MNPEHDGEGRLSGYWNYRVLRFQTPGMLDPQYAIHEVYFDAEGRITGCTEEEVSPFGESLEELREDLEAYKKALDLPVLTPNPDPQGPPLIEI